MQQKSISIYFNRLLQFSTVVFVLSFFIFINASFFIFVFWEEKASLENTIFAFVIPSISTLICFFSLKRFIKNKALLVLTEEGFSYQLFLAKTTFRKWDEIEYLEIRKVGEENFSSVETILLLIHVKNAAEEVAQMNWLRRSLAKGVKRYYNTPFVVTLSDCQKSVPDCIICINEFMEEIKLPEHLQIQPNAEDFLIFHPLIIIVIVAIMGTFFFLFGLYAIFEGQLFGGLILCLFAGVIISIFFSQILNKNAHFIYSKKQKEDLIKREYEKFVEKMGKKYDF